MNSITKDLVTIVIPTYNSQRTLGKVLDALERQTYPQKNIEILIVDGGSKDETLKIAEKYGCRIIKNTKTLQVYAKQMGVLEARGKYIIHLDSDEVLTSKNSIEKKLKLFLANNRIKAVLSSGYITPKGISSVNYLINEFGEPFSYFLFRSNVNPKFFIKYLKSLSKVELEDNNGIAFDFSHTKFLPPIELSALSVMIERKYLLKSLKNLEKDPTLISQAFYYFVKDHALVGVTKEDGVDHYSVSGWSSYLRKIRSRIINNVYLTDMGKSALSGRDSYYPKSLIIRKYMFIPYTLSVVFPLLDGLYLAVTRKKVVFLSLPLLNLYILILSVYYSFANLLGIKPKSKGYGQ